MEASKESITGRALLRHRGLKKEHHGIHENQCVNHDRRIAAGNGVLDGKYRLGGVHLLMRSRV